MIDKFIAIMILVCPTLFWVGKHIRTAQEIFYQILVISLVSAYAFINHKDRITKLFAVFVTYSSLLYVLGGADKGATILFNIFLGFLLYLITLKSKDSSLIFKTIVWVCIINIIYMAIQRIGFDFIYSLRGPDNTILQDNTDYIGFLALKASMGMWMALGSICMLIINPFLSILFALPLYLSKCTGAVIGSILGVGLWAYYIKRRMFKYVLISLLLISISYVVFVDTPMGMMGTRPPMWKMVLNDTIYGRTVINPYYHSPFLRNPITGFGLDSFRRGKVVYLMETTTQKTVRAYKTPNGVMNKKGETYYTKDGIVYSPKGIVCNIWDNAHNEFIMLFYEFGFIGVFIICLILYNVFHRFYHSVKTDNLIISMALLLAVLGFSISQFPLHLARLAFLGPIILAVIVKNTNIAG